MTFANEVAQYKANYPGLKIRAKSLPLSISLDDEASCHEALSDIIVPDGIVSGLTGSILSSNLTIQPGTWKINKIFYTKITVSAFSLETPDGTLSRYDLFYADATNNIQKATGTLSATPILPALPNNTIQVCNVLIQPSGYTLNQAPDGDYVNTTTNQPFIDGVKTFIRSPQVPNGVNAQDAVAFNQLATITGAVLNNGIGPTTTGFFGLGGSPLIQETTLDLSTFDFFVTQGLQTAADYTAWFNTNDRAIIDAGYFRNNQNYRRWVSGGVVNQYNLFSNFTNSPPDLYLAQANISSGSNTTNPSGTKFFAASAPNYTNWAAISSQFIPLDGNYLIIEAGLALIPTGSGMITFPLFSKPIGALNAQGGDYFEFSLQADQNSNPNFVYRYKFFANSIPGTDRTTWHELPPTEQDTDIIVNTNLYQYRLHIDVCRDSGNQNFEFRSRVELIFNSGNVNHTQSINIEFKDALQLSFFNSRAIPSNYWKILNAGTNPNTLIPNWLGLESGTPAVINNVTTAIGTLMPYSIKTRGNTAIFNNTTSTNIANFQNTGADAANVTIDGYFRGAGIYSLSGLANGFVSLSAKGTVIGRSTADSIPALKVQNTNLSSTGDVINFQNANKTVWTLGIGGNILQTSAKTASAGVGIAHNMMGFVKPSANSDSLIALKIATVLGNNTIASIGTLVGGSGYPNGIGLSLVTGGTGTGAVLQVTVVGGIITTLPTIVESGVNYTVGDVLSIVLFDPITGLSTGSGGSVTVATNTAFTGLTQTMLEVDGGLSKFAASISTYPSIVLPQGVTYTGNTSGAIWQDGTHLYAYINGAARQLDQQTGGGGTITAVAGTANRIHASAGPSVTVDIDSAYIGQSSITTLGIIATGVWNGTAIGDSYISSSSAWNAKMNNPMTTAGDIIVGGTVTSGIALPTRLAKGTANQLPSMNTAGTTLEYRTLALSGGLGGGYATGLINLYLQDTIIIATNANITITGAGSFYELPTITANRSINIGPASSSSGQRMIFLNKNTSTSFSWSFLGSGSVVDTLGNTITNLSNGFLYTIESDGINWVWMDNLSASTQYFVSGLFAGSINPTTPVPGTSGNPFTLGTGVIGIPNLSATGSASSSTFLRGDNSWATVPTGVSTSVANTWTATQTFAITDTSSSTADIGTYINHTVNQTGTAGFSDLVVNRINIATGSGTQKLLDLKVSGTSVFNVSTNGGLQILNAGAVFGGTLQVFLFSSSSSYSADGLLIENTQVGSAGNPSLNSPVLRYQNSLWNTTTSAINYGQFGVQTRGIGGTTPVASMVTMGYLGASSTWTPVDLTSLDAVSGNFSLLKGALKISSPTTSVTGSTSGTAVFSQPQQGGTLKMVLINLAALIGTASYTYPTPFVNTPVILTTNGLAASIAGSPSTTSVTITGATSSGILILIGY